MAVYSYKGITTEGKTVKGTAESESRSALVISLKNRGIFLEESEELKSDNKKTSRFKLFFRAKKLLPELFFQLSMLLKSGVPLAEALKITGNQLSDKNIKRIVLALSSDVNEGEKLSKAMENHRELFDEVHINIVKASEDVGRLGSSLENIAKFQEQQQRGMEKITTAMIYPLVVLSIGFGVVGFLLSYVVPKMENVFISVGKSLPFSTRILIIIGNIIKQYGLLIGFATLILGLLLKFYLQKNSSFMNYLDKKMLKSQFIKNLNLYKFSESMSFLLSEGITLIESLKSATGTITNRYYKKLFNECVEEITSGHSFSESLKLKKEFPELLSAAVKTGEKTGNLPQIFSRLSDYYIKKVEKSTAVFLALVEPVFILALGLIVGFIVISVMSPLFEINTLIK